MGKIKKIEYDDNKINMDIGDYILKIPVDDSRVKDLVSKAESANKDIKKDIKYYDKWGSVCLYPVWVAAALTIYGFCTNFILLDMIMIICGGMSLAALSGYAMCKIITNKLSVKANNNEYWLDLYDYVTGKKKEKQNEKTNNKTTVNTRNYKVQRNSEFSRRKSQIIQDAPITRINIPVGASLYHYNKDDIIQDEIVNGRKR